MCIRHAGDNIITLFYSYFLYNVSAPDKEGYPTLDLASDKDIKIDDALIQKFSPKQLAVERVIVKVFVHYRCNVIITDRLKAMFTSKLWRMGQAIRGGGSTKKIT